MLSLPAQTLLARRAELLLARVRRRSPAVDHVLAVAGGLSWLGRAVLIVALIAGLALSALDGSRRINLLSFPLIGLVAWNLFIYCVLIAARFAHRPGADRMGPAGPAGFRSGQFYERWIGKRVDSLLKQSTRFNAPLAAGLKRFTDQWIAIVRPLLLERAKRVMHLAAALMAVGLILGLYVRGVGLRYEAGWESTFLGPGTVRSLLVLFYGPAAALSGIGLPTRDRIDALRWTGVSGGGEAASWIHLIALTAMLYIVVPRLILAGASGLRAWRLSRSPPLPTSLLGYARTILGAGAGGAVAECAAVTAFAYEPSPASIAGLQTLLAATAGGIVKIEMREVVRYGEEKSLRERLVRGGDGTAGDGTTVHGTAERDTAGHGTAGHGTTPDWQVLVMTVASTPEAENHGAVIGTMRDSPVRTTAGGGSLLSANAVPLLVVVDTGPYAARMKGDASFDQRLQDRCSLWSEFVAGYGLRACIVDLSQIVAGEPSEIEAREIARAALWPARGQQSAP